MDYKFRLEGSEEFHEPTPISEETVDTKQEDMVEAEATTENVADGNGVVEKDDVTPTASEEVLNNTEELSEDKISEYLKNNPSLLDKFKPTQELDLDEDVKKFLEFKKETGRSYSDFVEYQKEVTDFSEEDLVRNLIRERNPELSEDEVDDEFYDTFGYDEDLDDEKDIKKKQREYKKAIAEASDLFNSLKDKYKVPLLVNNENVPEEYKTAKEALDVLKAEQSAQQESVVKQTEHFLGKTEEFFTNDFKGFEFKVGEESLVHKPSNVQEVKTSQSNIVNFFQKFLDETGTLKDIEGYHKALYVAMNYDSILKNVYETATAKAIENETRNSKNIDMGMRPSQSTLKTGGLKMKIVQ